MRRLPILLIVAAAPLLAAQQAQAQEAGTYPTVTRERLEEPGPGDWLMYRRTYNGWGYSPLDQITKANVAGLVPVWSLSTGLRPGTNRRR